MLEVTPLSMLQARLETTDKGVPYAHQANVLAVLAFDPKVSGLVGYNEFEEEPQILRAPPTLNPGDKPAAGPYPRSIRAADIVGITAYIQRAHLPKLQRHVAEDGIRTDAERHRFHPVREWLSSLKHDGTPRLDTWLMKAFGAEDNEYTKAIGAKILIAAVRRVRQPGCKFDTMPVLEGGQGIGKSSCVRRLFSDDWFTDSMPPDLKSKDGAQAVLGIWCIEFAEIEHLIRTDAETMKAFLSRPVERFRPPYERSYLKRGRECVFIGTTNSQDYLRDATGNRRIWPIKCQFAEPDWVSENREQLWAEAAAREAAGEAIWLDDPDVASAAVEMQRERMEEDVWTQAVRSYLLGAGRTTIPQVLETGLGIPKERHSKREEMRVSRILATDGWVRHMEWSSGKAIRVWKR